MTEVSNTLNALAKIPLGGPSLGLVAATPLFKKEKFETTATTSNQNMSMAALIYYLVNLVICMTAFYFVFKCGGHFLDFLGACCCSICYIVYRLAVPCVTATQQVVQQVPVAAPVATSY